MNHLGFLTWVAIGAVIIGGWFINLATLLSDQVFSTGDLGVRVVGLFVAPLGAIMGYFFQ